MSQRGLVEDAIGNVLALGELPKSIARQTDDIIRVTQKAEEARSLLKDGKKLRTRGIGRIKAPGCSMGAAQVTNDVILRNAQTLRHPEPSERQRRPSSRPASSVLSKIAARTSEKEQCK